LICRYAVGTGVQYGAGTQYGAQTAVDTNRVYGAVANYHGKLHNSLLLGASFKRSL